MAWLSQNNLMQTQLPHRFRERQFRTYEPYITQIVNRFPQVSIFGMHEIGASSVTFSCRLRDAIRSLKDNKWTTTVPDSFWDIEPSLIVSDRGKEVWVGDKAALSVRGTVTGIPEATSRPAEGQPTRIESFEQLDRLVSLVNDGILAGPRCLQHSSTVLGDVWVQLFETKYPNVMVTFEAPDKFYIV